MKRARFQFFLSTSRKRFGALKKIILRKKKKIRQILRGMEGRFSKARSFSEARVCISCFISALRPITSFVRWHLHVNGKSERAGIRQPRAGINQKGNLKKGLQPARCVTTPKGCRTANPQECHYLKEIVSLTRAAVFLL